jgi:glucan endo-1,3-alpha-glucosidase
MPHTGLISLIRLYATAFKTGSYPAFSDKLWLWTRPHFRNAVPRKPTNAKPNHWEWSADNLYVVVTLASPATVKIESGANYATWTLPAGLTKLAVASNTGAIRASIVRGTTTVKKYDSSGVFSYTNSPEDYNFNYFVAEA